MRAAVAAVLGTGIASVVSYPAAAQDQPAVREQLEEITVTGSRIVRRDYIANSPIVTVESELLENSSSGSLEVNLNKLPQFNPTDTPTTEAGDIQATATNTPGSATVSLRGIGSNRNLVLLDGRRATPGNASMVVDINTIPAAAIERVEIITGGASSTYGADAVGGVVNFILKKNFQGMEISGQYGASERGDGEEFTIDGIMGTDFAEGRGNISLSFSLQDRQAAKRKDRSWYRELWLDPSVAGNAFFPSTPGYAPGINAPSRAALYDLFPDRTADLHPAAGIPNIYFNPDGTAFTGFSGSDIGAYRFQGSLDGLQFKRTTNGLLAENWLDDELLVPLDRKNFFVRGSYEINDWVSVFAQGMFNRAESSSVQQPPQATDGWSAQIPVDGRDIPADLAQLLASRPDPTAPWQLYHNLDMGGNRSARTDVFTYNMMAGFEGIVPGSDWTWELFASEGESETSSYITGIYSLSRYRQIISAPDWGKGLTIQGNTQQGGFGASTATCTSGLNPFMPVDQITQDCIDAIAADLKTRSTMKQTNVELNAQGGLFDLPAGQVRAAVGASYRKNEYEFLNDTLTTQGRSFDDQAIGIYPSGNSFGEMDVTEFYGELLVPVLANLPLIQRLDLELGARTSDYNTTGSSFTWKALADWQVNDYLRVRGGFNRAERAPNLAELFLAQQQTFSLATGGDVCSVNNRQPWSANPERNPNAAGVRALCEAMMGAAGAAFFYGNDAFQGAGPAFVFPTVEGNPNLEPETAKTWTAGIVFSSPFQSPLLERLSLTVDYYTIEVEDAIGLESPDYLQQGCFDTAFNPTLDVNNPLCQKITRNVGIGTLGNVLGTYVNNGRFETSGVDAQINWSTDIGPGTFGINTTFSYLIDMEVTEFPGAPTIDYAGTLGGGGLVGLSGGFFQWKLFNNFSYTYDRLYVGLQWQHLPSVRSGSYALDPNTTTMGAPSYDLFNLATSYAVTDNTVVRFGVDNLFDKAPPRTGVNTAPPPGTLAGGSYDAGNYDVIGRRFYIGATTSF